MTKAFRIVMTLASTIFTVHLQTYSETSSGVITFKSDAAWCWFQDERAVVDTVNQKLIIGSTNMQASVDVTIYDLKNNKVESSKRFGRLDYTDDHNAPGLLIGPDGSYIAMWAHHYDKYNTHYSIYKNGNWSSEKTFNWNNIPGGTDYTIAYNNVYYLSKEERMFDFSRANDRAPNFLYSEDNGNSWKFGGQLTTNKSNTYNKGYYKYWSNGVDRIDMVFTEQHPRDDTTSIYHGYIMGGKAYNTFGEVADDDIYNRDSIPSFSAFTKVFAHNTDVDGVTMGRCWQSDVMRYADSTIAILFYARADDDTLDHRNFYTRFDGKEWKTTYLGKAGKGFYPSEQDYTGLGALCPDDPGRIYLSSPYKPGDDNAKAGKREIWRGTTKDQGATWEWEAITKDSNDDNFRPIVPQWTPGKEALLWFHGTYTSAQNFSTTVVGILSEYDVPVYTTRNNGHNSLATPVNSDYITVSAPLYGNVLQFTTMSPSPMSVQIFTASGKTVTALSGKSVNGSQVAVWNTMGTPAGIYLARIAVGNHVQTNRVTVQ